ncbi:Glyoxylate/hydroxypyruvate reductase A [Streptomyces sp. RB5]|uniref:Glyoxylate/hydroxypyruvate reductase A n=1 Tax=Streptomyces smaragdinus TaxID=2585196 RepID=A0A7K0CSZ9_9ACTN|nr:Glyoxylate/hydroxypyruvate reductase A [Streptomyces smaragdinus]
MPYDELLNDAELIADPTLGDKVLDALADTAGRRPARHSGAVPARPYIYVGNGLPAELRTPRLRWFHSSFAGNDAVLRDFPAGALLTRTVGRMNERIAQYVLGWLLADAQYVPEYLARHAAAEWHCVPGDLVAGRLALVYGTGRIGAAVGALLQRVGIRTVGVARRPRPTAGFDDTATAQEADALLPRAAWVVNVLPLTPATAGFFASDRFSAMRGALFVNVGRGATADTSALASALHAGTVRRAILDVLPAEPAPPDAPAWHLPHTVLTSHSAGVTTPEDVIQDFAACWSALRSGRRPELAVDVGRGY